MKVEEGSESEGSEGLMVLTPSLRFSAMSRALAKKVACQWLRRE